MPRSPKATSPHESRSLRGLEQEILAHSPQVGILDSASLGFFAVAANVGELAAAWRDHRILMQDLNTEVVTVSLGELLGAVVQMAHAVGISLDTLAEGQIQRMSTAPGQVRKRKAPATIRKNSPLASEPTLEAAPASRRKRTPRGQTPTETSLLPPVTRSRGSSPTSHGKATEKDSSPTPTVPRPSRAARSPSSAAAVPPPAPVDTVPPALPTATRRRRTTPPAPMQSTVLGDEPVTQRRQQAPTSGRSRSRAAKLPE